jgi:enoyl-CoA hydratase
VDQTNEPKTPQPSSPEPVLLESQEGTVRWLTLNRPAQRNALSPELITGLRQALARADEEPAVRVICLTAAGDRAFCAGADLGAAVPPGEAGLLGAHEVRRAYAALLLLLSRLGKPVVARVNGAALAGGLGLLCACDFALAADDVKLGAPEIDVGLLPYMALAPLVRVVGRRAALEIVLTGRKLSAAEGVSVGLLNRAVPRAELDAAVGDLLQTLAGKSPAVLRLGRRAFRLSDGLPYEQQLEMLCGQLSLNALAEDAMEDVAAFLEKRASDWKGR